MLFSKVFDITLFFDVSSVTTPVTFKIVFVVFLFVRVRAKPRFRELFRERLFSRPLKYDRERSFSWTFVGIIAFVITWWSASVTVYFRFVTTVTITIVSASSWMWIRKILITFLCLIRKPVPWKTIWSIFLRVFLASWLVVLSRIVAKSYAGVVPLVATWNLR